MPGSMILHTSQRMEPMRVCAMKVVREVMSMVEGAVPTARCCTMSCEMPICVKRMFKSGTMMKAPPTPNMPDSRPTSEPPQTRMRTI